MSEIPNIGTITLANIAKKSNSQNRNLAMSLFDLLELVQTEMVIGNITPTEPVLLKVSRARAVLREITE